MEDFVLVNEKYRILLCRICQNAVRPGGSIEGHFRAHRVKGQELRGILDHYDIMALRDPLTVELPADGSAAIAGLHVLDGFRCTQCRFLTIARDNITRHWKAAGHIADGASGLRCTHVRLQSWIWQQRKYARYWVVGDGLRGCGASTAPGDSAMEAMIAGCTAAFAAEDTARLRTGDLEEGIDRDSGWVKRLGWVRHFGSRDKLAIFEAAEWCKVPTGRGRIGCAEGGDEALQEHIRLIRLAESFDREVERCCWRLESVPTETLQWLGGLSTTAPSSVPFGRKGKEASMAKYQLAGQRYLGFCLRAYYAGREAAFMQWAVRFTDEQWSLLGDVAFAVAGLDSCCPDRRYGCGWEDRDEEDEESKESEDGEDGEGADKEHGKVQKRETLGPPQARQPETGPLDQAVFRFVVASVKQHIGGRIYANPLLCFCAALGIRKAPLGFTEPHLYTGMLAAVLWWSRLFFLEDGFAGQSRDLEAVGAEAVLAFRDALAQWMFIGTHTVTSTIIGWMAYGKGWRQQMGGQPSIRWSDDQEALFHSGERIAVEDFCRTARGLVADAEGLLDGLLGGAWAHMRAMLDMGRIADDMVRLGAGQSFVTHAKNTWLDAGPGTVMRLVGSSVWDAARSCWKWRGVKKWLRQLRRLREGLMVLVHIWGGQPGRGPELTTLRHCDSWQLMRNVFVLDGHVMLVTDRDKMKALRDNGRKVARFLPDRIGQMVVAYIAWLLPSERMLRRSCGLAEPRGDQLEYMWRDGDSHVWDTARLSAAMAQAMQAGTGVRIGVARYRPIAIELGRRIRGLAIRQAEVQMEEDDEDENVDVDPLTGEAVDVGGSWNIVWDLQATHGTKIARQHYAVHIGLPGQLQPEMIATFREVSRLWHQFLESGSSTPPYPLQLARKRKEGPVGGTEVAERGVRKQARTTESPAAGSEAAATAGLRVLLGPGARWTSQEQADSMQAIMRLGPDATAICVLPTGAGKSLLFMVPAVLGDGGTSIVVVPFVALMEDLVTRATAMGVDCTRYQPSLSAGRAGLPRASRLVVVSADLVATAEFTAYADGLVCAGRLQRIFVDECHTVLTDIGYRARLGALKSLRRFGCAMVLLTATLPVVLEGWFRDEMLAQGAVMVRARTTKANCQYCVELVRPGRDTVQTRTVDIIQQLSATMAGNQKGVVYCRSRQQCITVAEAIGCGFHHSGMSEGERRVTRDAWVAGAGHRWIAATSGLGTGVDIAGIVAVVHMELPYGLVDFVQQTGRGGRRAGEVVRSVIVHDGRPGRQDAHRSFVDESNAAQMEQFVSTPGCRRAVLAAFMDGVEGERCGGIVGAEACDRCAAGAGAEGEDGGKGNTVQADKDAKKSNTIWKAYGVEEGRRVRMLMWWLDEVVDECPVCHVRQHYQKLVAGRVAGTPQHTQEGEWCKVVHGEGGKKEAYSVVRRRITFGQLACCFTCKLPLDWCRATQEGGRCAYVDQVLSVVVIGSQWAWVRKLARAKFGVEVVDQKGFYRWLGTSRRFHGTAGTNVLALWEEMIWTAYKGGDDWFARGE